jgi:hypothetical protein
VPLPAIVLIVATRVLARAAALSLPTESQRIAISAIPTQSLMEIRQLCSAGRGFSRTEALSQTFHLQPTAGAGLGYLRDTTVEPKRDQRFLTSPPIQMSCPYNRPVRLACDSHITVYTTHIIRQAQEAAEKLLFRVGGSP